MTVLASSPPLTPMVAQIVVALLATAVVLGLAVGVLYVLVTGSMAWGLVVIVGLIRLIATVARVSWATLRTRLGRGRSRIAPLPAPPPAGTRPVEIVGNVAEPISDPWPPAPRPSAETPVDTPGVR
jgi:hypothetical protein